MAELKVLKEVNSELEVISRQIKMLRQQSLDWAESFLSVQKNVSAIRTPSDLKSFSSNNSSIVEGMKKESEGLAQTQAKLQQVLEKLRTTEARLQQQRTSSSISLARNTASTRENSIANQILRAETDRNFRANTLLAGAYSKASAQLLILKKQAKDYAISLGEIHPKTLQAIKDANDLSGRINSADNAVGDFQRNVGNYSNSITKGFGSIFSVVRQLAYLLPGIGIAGILGFATEPIIKYVTELINANKGVKSLSENTKDLNASVKEGNKQAGDEISKLDLLYKTATNVNLSIEQRQKAVNKLQEQYPSYFANIDDEIIRNGKAEESYNKLRDAIFDSARAKAIQGELEKRAQERFDKELEILEAISEAEKEIQRLQKSGNDLVIPANRQEKVKEVRITNSELIAAQERLLKIQKNNLEKFRKDARNEDDLLLKAQQAFYKKSAVLEADRIKVKQVSAKKDKEIKEEEIGNTTNSINSFNEQIAALKKVRDNTDVTSAGYEFLNDTIKLLEMTLKGLTEGFEEASEAASDGIIITDEQLYEEYFRLKKLEEATQNFFRNVSESALGKLGMGSLKQFFDGTFDDLLEGADNFKEKFAVTFIAVTEVAKEAFSLISQFSQSNFDAEFTRLEKQRDYNLKFAGDSVSGKEAIDEQYEEKRRQIQKRQAEAQKRLALFNIAINTAQGVTAALALGPIGIPLAAVIGALGLVQTAIVSSQEIPQFFKGGKHKGGLMMVNDAKGNSYKEIVVTPDGKIIQPEGRNVIMDAPAGTQIFTPEQVNKGALLNLLAERGISMNQNVLNKLESRQQPKIDLSGVIKAINEKPTTQLSIDKKGISAYTTSNGIRTQRLNSRFNISD